MLVAEEEDAPLPQRRRRSHKWSAGSVLVVGGSPGMIGASVFAGRAALSFGAGSVYLAADDSNRLQAIAPDVPVMTLDDARDDIRRFDVVLAGPGLAPADISVTLPLLQAAENLVLDAGALRPDVLEAVVDSDVQIVVTPHDAEFTRLSGTKPGTFSVRSFARANGITVVRKGSPTMVTDGSAPVLIRTGGPELASIGTGDVLAGMIAALWSRGLDGFRAAISGSFWHGRAGRSLSRRRTVTARGLVAEIGRFAW